MSRPDGSVDLQYPVRACTLFLLGGGLFTLDYLFCGGGNQPRPGFESKNEG